MKCRYKNWFTQDKKLIACDSKFYESPFDMVKDIKSKHSKGQTYMPFAKKESLKFIGKKGRVSEYRFKSVSPDGKRTFTSKILLEK